MSTTSVCKDTRIKKSSLWQELISFMTLNSPLNIRHSNRFVFTEPINLISDLIRLLVTLFALRPNLKDLSRGLNLSLGSNMVGSTSNCIQYFKIQAGAQLKLVFWGFETGLTFIKFGLITVYIFKLVLPFKTRRSTLFNLYRAQSPPPSFLISQT